MFLHFLELIIILSICVSLSSKNLILSERILQDSLKVLSSLSREVILALAEFSSRLRSSFSIPSFDKGTAFFFDFLGGGAEAGATEVGGTQAATVTVCKARTGGGFSNILDDSIGGNGTSG